MIKPKPSKSKSLNNGNVKNKSVENAAMGEKITQIRKKVSTLTYEESLQSLEIILEKLQRESVPVDDLQSYYLQGSICLEHCEKLLSNIEQQVIELDPETLQSSTNSDI